MYQENQKLHKNWKFVVLETLVLDNVFALYSHHLEICILRLQYFSLLQFGYTNEYSSCRSGRRRHYNPSLPQAPEKKEERYAPVATNMKLIEA